MTHCKSAQTLLLVSCFVTNYISVSHKHKYRSQITQRYPSPGNSYCHLRIVSERQNATCLTADYMLAGCCLLADFNYVTPLTELSINEWYTPNRRDIYVHTPHTITICNDRQDIDGELMANNTTVNYTH